MLKFFYLILKCELLFPQIKLIVAEDSPRLVKVLRRIIVKQNNLKYISTQIHNSEPEVPRITIKINQKKINYLQRPKVVGHRQDTIVGHNLGNCDRKPGIREKGETEKGYRECYWIVDISLPELSKIKKLQVQNECILLSVNYTC